MGPKTFFPQNLRMPSVYIHGRVWDQTTTDKIRAEHVRGNSRTVDNIDPINKAETKLGLCTLAGLTSIASVVVITLGL
jgi:hypothetical protein